MKTNEELLIEELDKMPGYVLSNIPRNIYTMRENYPYLYNAIMDAMTGARIEERRNLTAINK